MSALTGADALLRTAAAAGLDICFANPGTTELDLVKALEGSGVRPILGLFEGVCTGAADAYGRLAERPALVLLHLGPGLANGLANLHNAAKARTPVVVIVGDHATTHTSGVRARFALCRLARPLASPGPRCSSASAGRPAIRA